MKRKKMEKELVKKRNKDYWQHLLRVNSGQGSEELSLKNQKNQ